MNTSDFPNRGNYRIPCIDGRVHNIPYFAAMRILLADDQGIVRHGLRALLESQDGWEICGEAETGQEAIDKTRQLKPDIVVLDISMPLLNGFAAAKAIKEYSPGTAVVVYSVYESEAFLKEALRIGLDGYVSKTDRWQDILHAIEEVERRRCLANSGEKPAVTLPGTVEKVIPPLHPNQPEKAQISVEGAEDLYKEIRVDNTLQDPTGNPVALKAGAQVEVTIEADREATEPKKQSETRKKDQSTEAEHKLGLGGRVADQDAAKASGAS
jgi:DNA-binding NarL/FixJ family response regulator